MGMTLVEKILARAVGQTVTRAGDVVEPCVDLAMSHENGALVINQFEEIYKGTGLPATVWDPGKIAIIFDHRVPAEGSKTATNQKKVREFVSKQGITKFHDIRGDEGGICHQILPENGYVRPGTVVVGTDSHTTSHGALGAFSFGIGATEMASVWALGKVLNVEVPGTIKVVVNGAFQQYVLPKDLILSLIGKISAQGANFKVIEFHGRAIENISTSGRLTICNMAVEAGATSGIVPADAETIRYLHDVAGVKGPIEVMRPDEDAIYDQEIEIDASALGPQVACPHTVDNVKPVEEVAGKLVNQIVIGSCTNGRLDDIQMAAGILKGKKVARNVRMLVFPGFSAHLPPGTPGRIFIDAHGSRGSGDEFGLRPVPGGAPGSVGGRGRCPGHDQPKFQRTHGQPVCRGLSLFSGRGSCQRIDRQDHRPSERSVSMSKAPYGNRDSLVVLKLGDDVSTDIIYPGRFMATVLPTETPQYAFADQVIFNAQIKNKEIQPHSVIVAGNNFGCGSSREQAASCLKGPDFIVIARNFARIFLQNSINLGLNTIICPGIEANEGDELNISPTQVVNQTSGKSYEIVPLPQARQSIIDAGGLIPYTRQRLMQTKK